jgi:hypothetical protein
MMARYAASKRVSALIVFARGADPGKELPQDVGAMLSVMQRFGWYVLLPIPFALSFYWFVAILVEYTAAGVAAGLVYRP